MFSDGQPITTISVTELSRAVSAVLEQAAAGGRVVVTRHGLPIAVIASIQAGEEILLAGSEQFGVLRREAREELEDGTTTVLVPWR